MEFQDSLHYILLFTNTVSMSYIIYVRIIVNSKWE